MGRNTGRNLRNRRRKQKIGKTLRQQGKQEKQVQGQAGGKAPPA